MDQFEVEICCILQICCGGHNNRDAKAALARKLVALPLMQEDADRVAAYIIDTYDLAPAGSLKAYRDAVAEMAREYPYHE